MWRQTHGKEAVLSRWAIGCSPIDRTTSTSEDGEVICNEKKSQGYRGTDSYTWVENHRRVSFRKKRRGELWLRDPNNEICQRRKSLLSIGVKIQASPSSVKRNHPGCWSKWSARNHRPLLENWPLMVRAGWKATFVIYRCIPAVSFRTLWTCYKIVQFSLRKL